MHYGEISAVSERFLRTLNNEVYRYMTSKNVHIDKLDDRANKYNIHISN